MMEPECSLSAVDAYNLQTAVSFLFSCMRLGRSTHFLVRQG